MAEFLDDLFFGEERDIPEILNKILRNWSMDIESVIPAVVVSYDRVNNIVEVQPALNRMVSGAESDVSVKRAAFKVSCLNPVGGGIGISFPLKQGETGWVIACDRDSTFFKQLLSVTNPATYNIHKYEFGFFIPDKIRNMVINAEDIDALTIQTLDGKTEIAISSGTIKVVSTGVVNISAAESASITAPTISLKGDTTIDGTLTVTGAAQYNSTLKANGLITGGSITLQTHRHSGVTTGSGNTGVPTP